MDKPTQNRQDHSEGATSRLAAIDRSAIGWRDAGWLTRYAARGLCELIRARITFQQLNARDIPRLNEEARSKKCEENAAGARLKIERIAFVLPRISARLPWRSDCLVQALAGRRWLTALGLSGEIHIGVERPDGGEFGSHAWLIHDGMVVTGGDVSRYDRILG